MKPSQQKTFDWYIKHSNWFSDIKSINNLDTGEVEIVTSTHYYTIGKKGGLTSNVKI